jgi:hypothetical protein
LIEKTIDLGAAPRFRIKIRSLFVKNLTKKGD